MSTPASPGTSLATLQAAGGALVEERKLRNRVAQQIRGATWAREIDRNTQFAVAEYCQARDIDAATEIDILGGRIYKNAAYYERKGAELIAAGIAREVTQEHVEHDARLDEAHAEAVRFAAEADKAGDSPEGDYWRQQARAARRETARRRTVRVDFNAPEKAAAVVVTRITLVNGVAVAGCNWCGNGVRKGDPVGDAEPSKTAETRSARRAWRKLAGMVAQSPALRHHPALARIAANEGTDDDDSVAVHDAIAAAHATLAGQQEGFKALTNGRGNDGYRPLRALDDETYMGGAEPAPTGRQDVAYDLDHAPADAAVNDGGTPDAPVAEDVEAEVLAEVAESRAEDAAAIGGQTLAGGRVQDALFPAEEPPRRRGRNAVSEGA